METAIREDLEVLTSAPPDHGLVSIIMPNYNSAAFIEETVSSVLAQTYPHWELLIADDCSTDNSPEILKKFDDPRIRILSNERNSGAAVTRNRAIEAAAGRWIAFLDSDDLWDKEKLEKQLLFMKERKCAFSFTHYYFDKGNHDFHAYTPKKEQYGYVEILKHNYIACPTVIYDAQTLGKVYMPVEAVKREDVACWLQILKRKYNAHCLPECLTTVKIRTDSVSYHKSKMIRYQWMVYRDVEQIPFLRSAYYMFHWALNGVLKYRKLRKTK